MCGISYPKHYTMTIPELEIPLTAMICMKNIPVRHIATPSIEPVMSGQFKIRDVADILGGKDMVHQLHRHDFYFILALQKGTGT